MGGDLIRTEKVGLETTFIPQWGSASVRVSWDHSPRAGSLRHARGIGLGRPSGTRLWNEDIGVRPPLNPETAPHGALPPPDCQRVSCYVYDGCMSVCMDVFCPPWDIARLLCRVQRGTWNFQQKWSDEGHNDKKIHSPFHFAKSAAQKKTVTKTTIVEESELEHPNAFWKSLHWQT